MAFNTISMKNPTKKQKPKSLYPAYKATKVEQSEWTQVVTRGVDPSHQDTIMSMTPKESIQQFHKLISRVRVCKMSVRFYVLRLGEEATCNPGCTARIPGDLTSLAAHQVTR